MHLQLRLIAKPLIVVNLHSCANLSVCAHLRKSLQIHVDACAKVKNTSQSERIYMSAILAIVKETFCRKYSFSADYLPIRLSK